LTLLTECSIFADEWEIFDQRLRDQKTIEGIAVLNGKVTTVKICSDESGNISIFQEQSPLKHELKLYEVSYGCDYRIDTSLIESRT
jgi:hypothetical protein